MLLNRYNIEKRAWKATENAMSELLSLSQAEVQHGTHKEREYAREDRGTQVHNNTKAPEYEPGDIDGVKELQYRLRIKELDEVLLKRENMELKAELSRNRAWVNIHTSVRIFISKSPTP